MNQLCEWVEFKNGTRVFLELLPEHNKLIIAVKRKGAKKNALYEKYPLKTTKGSLEQ